MLKGMSLKSLKSPKSSKSGKAAKGSARGEEKRRCNNFSMSRLCPIGFANREAVTVEKSNEVRLLPPVSWEDVISCRVDCCCEYSHLTGDGGGVKGSMQQTFAEQEQVFTKFQAWLATRIESNVSRSCVLVCGASGSGKSYTLFGKNR